MAFWDFSGNNRVFTWPVSRGRTWIPNSVFSVPILKASADTLLSFFSACLCLLSLKLLGVSPSTQAVQDSAKDLKGLFPDSGLSSGPPFFWDFPHSICSFCSTPHSRSASSAQYTCCFLLEARSSQTGDCPSGKSHGNVGLTSFASHPSRVKSHPIFACFWSLSSTFLFIYLNILCIVLLCWYESPI